MRRRLRITALTIVAAMALAACGKKGPLYLPDDNDESEATASVAPY